MTGCLRFAVGKARVINAVQEHAQHTATLQNVATSLAKMGKTNLPA